MSDENNNREMLQKIEALQSGKNRLREKLATATEELKRLRFRADFLESKRAEETVAFSRVLTELHEAVNAHRDVEKSIHESAYRSFQAAKETYIESGHTFQNFDVDKSIIADIPPGEGVKYHGR